MPPKKKKQKKAPARKRRPRPRPRYGRLLLATRIILTLGIAAALLIGPYCLYLSWKIEHRFSGRRWDIPSRVYSDTAVLLPGQGIRIDLLTDKLKALGYREVVTRLRNKGDMLVAGHTVDIFLHDLSIPGMQRPGFPVRITTAGGKIQTIGALPKNRPLAMVELEPEEIMLFYGDEQERRRLITLDEAPGNLINAVLAAEDRNFYHHRGIDPLGIARALVVNLWHGEIRQGGSTITQQLAKNYFLTSRRTFGRKLNEALIALVMEAKYTKPEILAMYLNEIYLGQKGSASINGFGEAAHFYYGKKARNLLLSECALLAGLIKSPGRYSPFADKKASTARRDSVLRAMHECGMISDRDLKAALAAPVRPAAYSPTNKKAPYFMDYLARQLRDMFPREVLRGQGLSIYTTIDMQVQKAAEQAVARGIARLEKARPALRRAEPARGLQAAAVVMDPKSGAIRAMVGGRDYAVSQFNRITQARRQPGSAFKPFVYLSSLDVCTPATMLSNRPRALTIAGRRWAPKNYDDIAERQLTMRDALARSVNLATVDLALRVGMSRVVSCAKRFEFSTALKPVPSLALGSCEIIPLELARAYCAFASGGTLPAPITLKKVADEKGAILALKHMRAKRIMPAARAYVMNSLLRSVVTDGTARGLAARGVRLPAAGKTGTTNNSRDAWFVGYTPELLALVWVGFDNGESIGNTGSTAALPIWADIVGSVPHCTTGAWYSMPEGVVTKSVCKESGQLAVKGACPGYDEVFLATRVPTQTCSLHAAGFLHKLKKILKPF